MHKPLDSRSATQNLRTFSPGEMSPVSGVYKVTHKTGHRPPHEVVAIRGEHFPTCRVCQTQVEFRAMRVISHMAHDWDFAGPVMK